ncbi:hypothetical protein STVIR_6213 [Streptomyces viridochromogenes Tue57]|uniref:Uncharacterized protein n=1 Tax=Streptomyces viridochromogenes Tue57 TaxID=1160705 RepID=L8P8T9_STRVR|nr:hypothetical protein STVIR_6213 [Streptomyces viridochromogenes Tue57]
MNFGEALRGDGTAPGDVLKSADVLARQAILRAGRAARPLPGRLHTA